MRTIDDVPLLSGARSLGGHIGEADRDRLAFFRRFSAECGDMGAMRFFRKVVVVNSPELVHEVLVEKSRAFEKSPILRGALRPLAGEGLFTSRYDLWKRQRKLMAPMFHPAQIGGYAKSIADGTLRGIATWRDGDVVQIARETTRITMAIAGQALFEAETFDEAEAIGEALTVALTWANDETASIPFQIQIAARKEIMNLSRYLPVSMAPALHRAIDALEIPVLIPGQRSRTLRAAIGLLDDRVQRMIDERRAAGLNRSDLLTTLLRARDDDDGSRMSDRQVRDEVLTLFVAGHETTATGLAWAMHFMARDPELYERVRREVDVLDGRVPEPSELAKLPLTMRVFKESLRYYPPVYVFGRETIADVEIGGYHLPRGSIVLVSPYALQHRPEFYPNPERFDPERFTPGAETARPKNAWLPFGAGPRTCIGNHFALMEGQIALALIVQRARFEATSEVHPDPGATLRPGGGLPMRVHIRERDSVRRAS